LEHGDFLVVVSKAGQASVHVHDARKPIGQNQLGARGDVLGAEGADTWVCMDGRALAT
jgi:hypothetical protein